MSRRAALPAVAVVVIAGMFVLVPWLTTDLGPTWGYLAVFLIYWFAVCLPMGLMFQDVRSVRRRLGLGTEGRRWVPWLALGTVLLIAAASIIKLPPGVATAAVLIAVGAALVNGFMEEFFWRGAWLAQAGRDRRYYLLGWALLVGWHVPLAFAVGVDFGGDEGPYALVGGAAFLGAIWSLIAWRTRRIGWAIISHIGVNAFSFIGLVSVNFV